MDTNTLFEQLVAGFDVLQLEYQKLYAQQASVERKLATARDQYNELAKLCGSEALTTPPISLSSSPTPLGREHSLPRTTAEILQGRPDQISREAASKVRLATTAAQQLRSSSGLSHSTGNSVKIWSGPSADRTEGSSSLMPSISESPLEQDFTIEGMPSRLGCPFAGMTKNRTLSSHAASVLSKYNNNHGSVVAGSTAASSVDRVTRVNGKESLSRRESRRASFTDPIKAEICGLSDHDKSAAAVEPVTDETAATQDGAEPGVCPIRFLDQHSPEEVATYFEKHKHELPRSHEICVRRYQNNETQIKELDAKYGNLVSMIQGLGAKHKEMLPEDLNDIDEPNSVDEEKVRQWAKSVSAQAVDGQDIEEEREEERQSHFERPLRDVRVGESPSRPWGIQVPIEYLEKEAESKTSSRPANEIATPAKDQQTLRPPMLHQDTVRPAGKCPFGFDKQEGTKELPADLPGPRPAPAEEPVRKCPVPHRSVPQPQHQPQPQQQPVFIAADEAGKSFLPTKSGPNHSTGLVGDNQQPKENRGTVFTGPVFIGYSVDDAVKIMKEWGR